MAPKPQQPNGAGDYGIKKIIPTAHQHPTQKPVELAKHFIRLHTKEDDIMIDPFTGYGSFLVVPSEVHRPSRIVLDMDGLQQVRRQLETHLSALRHEVHELEEILMEWDRLLSGRRKDADEMPF